MSEQRKHDGAPPKPKDDNSAKRKHVEQLLDEGLDETFPASDPVAMLEPVPDGEARK